MVALDRRTGAMMAASLSRTWIVGVLLAMVLTPPALVGQSSTPEPWLEFPSYDLAIVWSLHQGADAKEAAQLLVQAPASVDTFTKLVRADRLDDALVVLKRVLDTADAAQTIAALRALNADIVEIRQVVFRPLGDLPVYAGHFRFPTALPRFIFVRPDLQVKTSDGQVCRHTVYQRFPDLDHVLFLTSDDVLLLARLAPTIGGTKRRAPAQIMETPNQPIVTSVNVFSFWTRFFPPGPDHWGELETFPTVTQIEFVDAERTKANARVTLGYEGATVVLEKTDGKWRAVRLVNQWIS